MAFLLYNREDAVDGATASASPIDVDKAAQMMNAYIEKAKSVDFCKDATGEVVAGVSYTKDEIESVMGSKDAGIRFYFGIEDPGTPNEKLTVILIGIDEIKEGDSIIKEVDKGFVTALDLGSKYNGPKKGMFSIKADISLQENGTGTRSALPSKNELTETIKARLLEYARTI